MGGGASTNKLDTVGSCDHHGEIIDRALIRRPGRRPRQGFRGISDLPDMNSDCAHHSHSRITAKLMHRPICHAERSVTHRRLLLGPRRRYDVRMVSARPGWMWPRHRRISAGSG